MKSSIVLSLSFVLVAVACDKPDDLARRRAEVSTIAAYYQPILDGFQKRMQVILDRSRTIDPTVPGLGDVGQRFKRAGDELARLRGLVAPAGAGKSPIETSAETAAKAGNIEEVATIADHAREHLEEGATAINTELRTVEAWLAQLDARAKVVAQTPPPPAPNPTPTPPPATPEAARP
jgi:hypothetical protein